METIILNLRLWCDVNVTLLTHRPAFMSPRITGFFIATCNSAAIFKATFRPTFWHSKWSFMSVSWRYARIRPAKCIHVTKNQGTDVTQTREMNHMSKIFNFEILTSLSGNLKMLHFYATPLWLNIWGVVRNVSTLKTQYKTEELGIFLCQYCESNICATSDAFPLTMSHIQIHSNNKIVALEWVDAFQLCLTYHGDWRTSFWHSCEVYTCLWRTWDAFIWHS